MEGGILLGVAGGLLAAATGGLGAGVEGVLMGSSFFAAHGVALMATLALSGASMEAGAIADALSNNRGSNITIRQPASYRQLVLGYQRVGGVMVYASTTGSNHDHYHRVIVLAGHVCHSILNLYLDGRKVYWGGNGAGYQTRNGVTFGGWCDANDHIGPDGSTYNFNGNLVYAEARYGDQLPGDVMQSLTTNDPNWASSSNGTPYLGGCTYVYLQISDDAAMFPGEPEIRFDINGKDDIYDPRTGTTGFSTNPALLIADRMTDATFGLGMQPTEINEAQLIAAANVCDEPVVSIGAGGTEVRYAASWHGDTSSGPGDVIAALMSSCGGRLSRIGGEWFIWPAYWQGPSLTFDKSVLLGVPQWEPYRALSERYNRVTGTYTAPNYPYNAAGNLYDANSWYDGTQQDNFQFGFQPTNYPSYAQDTLHGYASDQWLTADGGHPLPKELSQPCTLSVSQAQRVAKITLMRNRYEGVGTLTCNLGVFGVQPCDVMQMTFPEYLGWENKMLEVSGFDFHIEERNSGNSNRALAVWCEMQVNETGPDVYEWDESEELTVYNVPAGLQQAPYIVPGPTALSITTSTSTGNNPGVGGNSTNYALALSWTAPTDVQVTSIEAQAKLHSSTTWIDANVFSAASTMGVVYGVNKGDTWDVRIRALRSNGATSAWVERDSYTV